MYDNKAGFFTRTNMYVIFKKQNNDFYNAYTLINLNGTSQLRGMGIKLDDVFIEFNLKQKLLIPISEKSLEKILKITDFENVKSI